MEEFEQHAILEYRMCMKGGGICNESKKEKNCD